MKKLCSDINDTYEPGCKLLISHEGHFYTDINITPSDTTIEDYEKKIHEMTNLDLITYVAPMKDITKKDYPEARTIIFNRYMPDLSEVETLIQNDEKIKERYVAYKAFIMSEFMPVLHSTSSTSEGKHLAKPLAIQWIQRYLTYKKVCKDNYRDYFQLSILSHRSLYNSFSINLLPNHPYCGTPWFNTLLKKNNGTFDMIKKHVGIASGYQTIYKHGVPWYFSESFEAKDDN